MPLGEYVQGRLYRGIVTGLNDAFVIDQVKPATPWSPLNPNSALRSSSPGCAAATSSAGVVGVGGALSGQAS